MRTWGVGLIVVATVVLAGCGPGSTSPGTGSTEPPAAVTTPEQATPTAVPPTPATTQPTLPTTQQQPPAAQSFVMPNLVGSNLQAAQDAVQALTGDPLFLSTSHDAGGKGRHQVLDRDWRVCSQNVAAGTRITLNTKVDFGVVRVSEACP